MASTDPEQWLDAHGDALFGYAMMRVQNQALMEDLVQEALLAGITSLENFAGKSSKCTWLVGVFKTRSSITCAKRAASKRTAPTSANWAEPALVAQNAELKKAMTTCVQRLPEKLRFPFILREIDELMQVLKVSTANNLWVMLSRGRKRVRTCLDALWNGAA